MTRIVYVCLEFTGDPSTLAVELDDDDDIRRIDGITSDPIKFFQDCARYQFILELLLRIVSAPINAGLSLYWGAEETSPVTRPGTVTAGSTPCQRIICHDEAQIC